MKAALGLKIGKQEAEYDNLASDLISSCLEKAFM